jgi:hypothetical protein
MVDETGAAAPVSVSKLPKLQNQGHPDISRRRGAPDPLLPYLPDGLIWEPACGKGNLLAAFGTAGRAVIGTDILGGHDFLSCQPPLFDVICSNPPFSLKDEFLARCYELGKPFALLLPAIVFDSRERWALRKKYGLQLLLPDGRIHSRPRTMKRTSRQARNKVHGFIRSG